MLLTVSIMGLVIGTTAMSRIMEERDVSLRRARRIEKVVDELNNVLVSHGLATSNGSTVTSSDRFEEELVSRVTTARRYFNDGSYTPRTRIYYVAAVEVDWDYGPASYDAVTGIAFPGYTPNMDLAMATIAGAAMPIVPGATPMPPHPPPSAPAPPAPAQSQAADLEKRHITPAPPGESPEGVCATQEEGDKQRYCTERGQEVVHCANGRYVDFTDCPRGCAASGSRTVDDYCLGVCQAVVPVADRMWYCDGPSRIMCMGGNETARSNCRDGSGVDGSVGYCMGKDESAVMDSMCMMYTPPADAVCGTTVRDAWVCDTASPVPLRVHCDSTGAVDASEECGALCMDFDYSDALCDSPAGGDPGTPGGGGGSGGGGTPAPTVDPCAAANTTGGVMWHCDATRSARHHCMGGSTMMVETCEDANAREPGYCNAYPGANATCAYHTLPDGQCGRVAQPGKMFYCDADTFRYHCMSGELLFVERCPSGECTPSGSALDDTCVALPSDPGSPASGTPGVVDFTKFIHLHYGGGYGLHQVATTTVSPTRLGKVYRKCVFREFTDSTFTEEAARPAHLGIQGPVLRAVTGDTLKVHFRNSCGLMNRTLSMHPHGVAYDKDSEGAPYGAGAAAHPGVLPGDEYMYTWHVPIRAGPGPGDDSSVVWPYHSHIDEPADTNAGLIGPLVVTAPPFADPVTAKPLDVDTEIFLLYNVFDENLSWLLGRNIDFARRRGADVDAIRRVEMATQLFYDSNRMHSINGYVGANVPALHVPLNRASRWYLYAMGDQLDLHAAHWHGTTLVSAGRRTDAIAVLPGQSTSGDMVPDVPGVFLHHCHTSHHIHSLMVAMFQVVNGTNGAAHGSAHTVDP